MGARTQFSQGGASSSILENNIIIADGVNKYCYLLNGGSLNADYNNLVARNGAWIGNSAGNWEHLIYWQRESSQDGNSLSHEPLFLDEAGGDYHLHSLQGAFSNASFVGTGSALTSN